ncbi:MAG: DNA internalization-related competence protein ComEC/Rec2 [Deltaproteobacteria bacterium]|nr:DNA internalization-related competence protein ComEC/Rec2 [Deltaproteobacteria bacterium]
MGGVLAFLGGRPLLGAALSFALGIGLAAAYPPGHPLGLLMGAAGLAALALLVSRAGPGFATLAGLAGFLVSGMGAEGLRAEAVGHPVTEAEWQIEGTVAEPVFRTGDRQRVLLLVQRAREATQGEWRETSFHARLSTEPVALWPGDHVRATVRLSPPRRDANPGAAGLEARWRAEGLVAFGSVLERQLVVIGSAPVLAPAAARFRARYASMANDAIADPSSRALVQALAIGDRAELSSEVNDDFSVSGLAHILSVSGLHIAVVAAGLYRALRWLLSRSERLLLRADVRALAALSALPATWLYVWVTGSDVPAVRSGVMASALFLAMALRRDADSQSSLGAALLAVLAWDPAALWSISFQLSFTAVAGLMLLTEPLRSLAPWPRPDPAATGWRARLARAGEALLTASLGSLAASIATAPMVAAAFHRASLVAVLSNAVALPVASGLTVLAAGSTAAFGVGSPPAAVLLCLAEPLARILLYLSHAFASLPFASTLVPAPSRAVFVAWYCALAGLALLPGHRRAAWRIGAPGLAVVLAVGLWRLAAPLLSHQLVVTFLSVGQGDASIVQLPGGESLLIDAGGDPSGRFDPGKTIVIPALAELGATPLRAAVLSHPHPDHLGGMLSVLEHVRVRELWMAKGLNQSDPPLARLLALAREKQVLVRELSAGERLALGVTTLEVLHPASARGLNDNDGSLVLRLRYREVSFLFPGDVEGAGESELLAASDLAATVLKVPHHGSRTSSSPEFVARVRPAHVVFSVGRNRFGFPHEEVVARYRSMGASEYRTDESGAVALHSDGRTLDVETWLP